MESVASSEAVALRIIDRSLLLGASSAGITNIEALKSSPSYQKEKTAGHWPGYAKSVLIIGLEHPSDHPLLDWWDEKPGGTEGNRQLIRIAREISRWIASELKIYSHPLPYDVEKGGIFLKDAAALAGLGVIGKNNLLLTPEFGPRIRLRGIFLDRHLEYRPSNSDFSPCADCDMPCLKNCPRNAFPQRSYNRERCYLQMNQDIENKTISGGEHVKYCRLCELSCKTIDTI